MVVYDVSSHQSFQSVGKWVQAVRSMRPHFLPGVLVANKMDISRSMEESVLEGKQFAKENDLDFFEMSAVSLYSASLLLSHSPGRRKKRS